MQIEAIVFDKDGTLYEFATTWEGFARSFLLGLTGGRQDRAAHVGRAIGFDLERGRFEADSILIAGTPDEVAESLAPVLPELDHAAIVDLLNQESAAAPQAEAVPLVPFLDDLRLRGLRLGVATNDAEVPARVHLDRSGISDRFDFVAGCDSGHGAKPGPGQLLAFAAHTGIAPARTVMVGDSLHDLVAGRAAGMATVGVLTGIADRRSLAPFADAVLPDIGHLPDWLTG